jgi:hypothetical protein
MYKQHHKDGEKISFLCSFHFIKIPNGPPNWKYVILKEHVIQISKHHVKTVNLY